MSRSFRTRHLVTVVALVAVGATLAGCSGPEGPRPITSDEADRLSEVLFLNYDDGGSHFVLNAAPTPESAITIDGDVDFVNRQGYALVSSTGSDAPVDRVVFSDAMVLENIPTLVDLAATVGVGSFTWVARPFDSTAYQLDSLLGVVLGLSGQQRENPLLLEQSGAQWLREDTVNGAPADVFAYSPQVRLWVEKDGTRLLRFEGNSSTLDRPIVVDLTEPGPVTMPQIQDSDVVQVEQVQDLYDAVRTGS